MCRYSNALFRLGSDRHDSPRPNCVKLTRATTLTVVI